MSLGTMLQVSNTQFSSPNRVYPSLGPRNASTPNLTLSSTTQQKSSSTEPSSKCRPATNSARNACEAFAALSKPLPSLPSSSTSAKPKRKSWQPRSQGGGAKICETYVPAAWISGQPDKQPYNIEPLLSDCPVPELWDEHGDTFVHLTPRDSCRSPSFRVRSSLFAASPVLVALSQGRQPVNKDLHASVYSQHAKESLSASTSRLNLYLDTSPLNSKPSPNGLDARVALRNLFAFLLGKTLVVTERKNTILAVFLSISQLLTKYGFTNIEGSTYGEIAAARFEEYVGELGLYRIQNSREKTIEALILGERMRSMKLYSEAFNHAAGNYASIQHLLHAPEVGAKADLVGLKTRNRLERASIEISQRRKSVNARLEDFVFPSLFAGVMSSKHVSERKYIQFDAWKVAFAATRRHVLAYYKKHFGSWPPKANSKKNNFEIDGLNRLVLRTVYADLCDMYDLYVNRKAPTTRSTSASETTILENVESSDDPEDSVPRILRRVFDEYDRSSPPVQPPIPFDAPILPSLLPITGEVGVSESECYLKLRSKKLSDDQIDEVLAASCNNDYRPASNRNSPFLASIRAFERGQARGSSITGLVDLRAGMWIFMYAVIQALPLLIVDTPGLRSYDGVEYFLCQPPRGNPPWMEVSVHNHVRHRSGLNWYSISGGKHVANIPADLIEYSVEGVYRRSHCWRMAAEWKELSSFPMDHSRTESVDSQKRGRTVEKQLFQRPQAVLSNSFGHASMRSLEPADVSTLVSRSMPSSRTPSRAASPGVVARAAMARDDENEVSLELDALPLPLFVSSSKSPATSFASAPSSPTLPPRKIPLVRQSNTCEDSIKVALTFDDILGAINSPKMDQNTRKAFQ